MTKQKGKSRKKAGRKKAYNGVKKAVYLNRSNEMLMDFEQQARLPRLNTFNEIVNEALGYFLDNFGFIDKAKELGIEIKAIDLTDYLIKRVRRENAYQNGANLEIHYWDELVDFRILLSLNIEPFEFIGIVEHTCQSCIEGLEITYDVDKIFINL